jgi:guanylate kinase
MQAKLFIFSAPSGAGKTTIVKHLLSKYHNMSFSVSATTRPRRPHETDGKDYYFLSPKEFETKITNGEFLEYEQVYNGTYYGTLKAEVDNRLAANQHVVFDVDVEGGLNIKKYYGTQALSVFVKVSSVETLAQRLTQRNTEAPKKLQERLHKALREMDYADKFDVVLLNDDLPNALSQAEQLVEEFMLS